MSDLDMHEYKHLFTRIKLGTYIIFNTNNNRHLKLAHSEFPHADKKKNVLIICF
jgi:hypothetical protein